MGDRVTEDLGILPTWKAFENARPGSIVRITDNWNAYWSFDRKTLYLIITQKLTFMKSGRFHTDFMKSGGFHTDFTLKSGGFHEICEIQRISPRYHL